MNYWQEYNKNLEYLFKEILSHNKSNTFNFLENNHYNHIRDLLALSIALNRKNDSDKYKILDYGSNIIPWTNLNNKIETSCLSVKIYDPFSNPIPFKKDQLGFDVEIINKIQITSQLKFDMTIFGSSSQYIKSFYEEIESNKFALGKTVLFTHTPLSLIQDFETSQNNSFQGKQYVRSFQKLNDWMQSKGYILFFKSTLPPSSAMVEKIHEKNTVYANLLFKKVM